MDLVALLASGTLFALVLLHIWYDRWCVRNGVARSAASTSSDSIFSGDGGGDGGD
jgi:hypothetical protein